MTPAVAQTGAFTSGVWHRLVRSPLAWIIAAVFVLHVIGIGWGLPASDAWDEDGIAPRDFLVGTAYAYWPGHYFTYPPVHLVLLTVLTLPISLVALARAPSLSPHELIAEFIRVPYMTGASFVARAVTLAMSLGIVLALFAFAREVRGRSAGYWVAAVAGVNAVFTYYAHTTNLDVPYLFWSCLSLLAFARAIVRGEPRRLRMALVLAALAVGTKDQAYALFVLSVPVALAMWMVVDASARAKWKAVLRELAIGGGAAIGLLLFVDGAIVNPRGFAARLRFLSGPASQDHASYAKSLQGYWLVIRDSAAHWTWFYPLEMALLIAVGIALALGSRREAPGIRVARLLPLCFAVSFTIAFNFVARRTEHRFLLPQMLLLGVYGGLAMDVAMERARGWLRPALTAAFAVVLAKGAFGCLAVDAALVNDPRYDAERWLAAHVAAGETLETYGNNVHLPRFPPDIHVTRVGPEPVDGRGPLPGVEEVEDDYAAIDRRRPKWILVADGWAWRYLRDGDPRREAGIIAPPQHLAWRTEQGSRDFFRELHQGRRGYRLAHVSAWHSSFWPPVDIHASTGREIRVFARDEDP